MASSLVVVGKFVGTASLGLLTGLSYTTTFIALPTLITLPSAPAAQTTFTHFRKVANRQIGFLTRISIGCFLTAFALSPSRRRHPYLLWTTLVLAASHIYERRQTLAHDHSCASASTSSSGKTATPAHLSVSGSRSGSDSGDWEGISDVDGHHPRTPEEDDDQVNGEEVRRSMERYGRSGLWKTVASGVAFTMSVVGLWGDRF